MPATQRPPASVASVALALGCVHRLRIDNYVFFRGTEVDRLLRELISTIEDEWNVEPEFEGIWDPMPHLP